jgi:hypothetical protein
MFAAINDCRLSAYFLKLVSSSFISRHGMEMASISRPSAPELGSWMDRVRHKDTL